jgi:ABC-type multidrug transport system permease subunit
MIHPAHNPYSTYFSFAFIVTLVTKLCCRTIAAFSTDETTALPVAGLFILILVLYTGFAIPVANIVWALRWIAYLNVRAIACLPFSLVLMAGSNSLSVTRPSP